MTSDDMSAAPAADSAAPDAMRRAMADYVHAVHQAYLDAASLLPPGDQGRLPLTRSDEVTVVAVGARSLHVLATQEALPAPSGQEVELTDSLDGLSWRLRFYDPVVLPALGLVDETDGPQPVAIRELLGIRTVLYHLSVPPGGGLTPHHALHAGTGLAHAHAAAMRDFDSIAELAPHRADLVAELRGADAAHLPRASLLLAREIAPHSDALAGLAISDPDPVEVRRALLSELRRDAHER